MHGLRDLSSQPGIKPVLPAMEAQRPNHWTAREFPIGPIFKLRKLKHKKLTLFVQEHGAYY